MRRHRNYSCIDTVNLNYKTMKNYRYILAFLCIGMFASIPLSAQDWEGGLFLGVANYEGDLVVPAFTPREANYGVGLVIRNNLTRRMAIRGNLLFGKLDGADANWDEPAFRQRRNFSFETTITELSVNFEYSPFVDNEWLDSDGKFMKKITPYGFAGIGVAFWDPTTNYNISEMGAAPFGTTIQRIDEDRNSDFSTTAFTIPIGGGVKADITDKIIAGLEFGMRFPFTDYLDGVSVAANPDQDDWYWFAGATVTFRIQEDQKKEDPLPMITDTDQDGVPDNIDQCPDTPGKDMFDGCPDTDGDMLADKDDRCPEVAGTIHGCPDTDGDGLADIEDDCPNEKGLMVDKGCPKVDGDSDGDGVADSIDECPNAAGPVNLKGCPDSDRDGIADKYDACPNAAGKSIFSGCPDTDNDGIPDSKDSCPALAGAASNNGCPGITVADREILDLAVKNVRFETGKDILKPESYIVLDKVMDLMRKYQEYSLSIAGYTDNVGNSRSNLRLSEKRAEACYNYLVGKGISPSRLTFRGYGEVNPVADNSTSEGRRVNRRVEFDLY